ncbi:hypothetical protein CLAFUR4_11556 [Fulvia fulva]|nr:hypothetical protein CLAFUR4_11556 [Fulvia fulva]WPV32109.1 hypothetical protein CLAFUW7_11555 [Fulvia fulva]
MPGTNCTLELDGANDETELFERNVEYKDEIKKKENRTLKKMVSLDAMAEECAALSPSDRLNPVHRTVSDVTIKDCPDDMPKLTRELAHLQTPSAGHRDPQTGDWKSEDPFAPGNAVGDLAGQGPPSCGAQVILPLRPKITLQSADSDQPRTLNENDMPTLTERMDGSKILMDQSATATDKVQVCEWSDIEMPSHSNPFFVPEAVHEQKDDVEPDGPIDEPSDLVEVFAIRPQKPALGEATERGAPHTTAGDTGTPSPKKVTTGLGGSNSTAIFWKFKPWNATPPRAKQTHNEAANDSDGAIKETPPRLRRRSSLDVEPSDSGRSPDAASTVSAMDVSGSPSMGDRVHFDFERADRAKRYAMLADNATAGDETNAVVFDDLDFALQPVSRNEAQVTPTATNQPPVKGRSRQGSAYSIDPDLQADLAEIYEFQNAMSGTTFDPNPVVVETSNPATPVLSSAQPLLQAGKDGYGNDGEPRNASGYQASSPSEDTPALSPGETKFWRDVQSCPFGTPQPIGDESPTQSLHKRQSASILSATPDAGVDGWTHDDRAVDRVPGDASDDVSLRAWVLNMSPSDSEQPSSPAGVGEEMPRSDSEQSLDEGLKLYRSFTSNPDIRYSDTPTIPEEDSPVDRQFASPDSAYNADQSSDAVKPVSPSESRSRKTTVASPPH